MIIPGLKPKTFFIDLPGIINYNMVRIINVRFTGSVGFYTKVTGVEALTTAHIRHIRNIKHNMKENK